MLSTAAVIFVTLFTGYHIQYLTRTNWHDILGYNASISYVHENLKFSPEIDEFLELDLVAENQRVDQFSRLLTNNIDVINEAQRIHFNIFKTLFGNYKYVMIFGLAVNENKGDSAITVGEILLLRRLKIEVVFHCFYGSCSKKDLIKAEKLSKEYSNTSLLILLHGGGNVLSYIGADILREYVLKRFIDFEVVLFPQSIWPRILDSQIKHFQEVYSSHPHLTFLYRDRDSYTKGITLFPKVRALLAPDMAFQIGAVTRIMSPTHDILWLRRSDDESLKYEIPDIVTKYDVSIEDWLKWPTPKGSTDMETAFLMATNGFLFLQRGRVVITDRLHGHILSTLLGIPHVILDPVNSKISSYMKSWTGGLTKVKYANSSSSAFDKALVLLKQLSTGPKP